MSHGVPLVSRQLSIDVCHGSVSRAMESHGSQSRGTSNLSIED